jgi:hypothetical protein
MYAGASALTRPSRFAAACRLPALSYTANWFSNCCCRVSSAVFCSRSLLISNEFSFVLVLISRMPNTPATTSAITPAMNGARGALIGAGGATRSRGAVSVARSGSATAGSSLSAAVPRVAAAPRASVSLPSPPWASPPWASPPWASAPDVAPAGPVPACADRRRARTPSITGPALTGPAPRAPRTASAVSVRRPAAVPVRRPASAVLRCSVVRPPDRGAWVRSLMTPPPSGVPRA